MRHVLLTLASSAIASMAFVGTASADPYDVYYDSDVGSNAVLVYAGSDWYSAQILEVSGSYYLVHYDGTASESDEWVPASRIQSIDGTAFTYGPVIAYDPVVQVYWGSRWYDGRVLGRRGNRYHVRYQGRDSWFTAAQLHMHARGHAARGWGHVHKRGGVATWRGRGGAPAAWHGRGEHRGDRRGSVGRGGRRGSESWDGGGRGGRGRDHGTRGGGRGGNGNGGGRHGGRGGR